MPSKAPETREKLWDVLTADERQNIETLLQAKVALAAFAPRSAYPRLGGREFVMTAWKNARPSKSVFAKAKAGWAVAALTGLPGGVDVIDVDDRNGGRETWEQHKEHAGTILGEVQTPGGSHYYIASTGMPTVRYGGVDVLGKGALVFLPGTQRPKYEGAGYKWSRSLKIDPTAQPDSRFAEVLLELQVREGRRRSEHLTTSRPSASGPRDSYQPYGPYGIVSWGHNRVASAQPGQRNQTLYKVAFYFGTQFTQEATLQQIIIRELLTACDKCRLTADDGIASCMDTISSGLNAGAKVAGGTPWQA